MEKNLMKNTDQLEIPNSIHFISINDDHFISINDDSKIQR